MPAGPFLNHSCHWAGVERNGSRTHGRSPTTLRPAFEERVVTTTPENGVDRRGLASRPNAFQSRLRAVGGETWARRQYRSAAAVLEDRLAADHNALGNEQRVHSPRHRPLAASLAAEALAGLIDERPRRELVRELLCGDALHRAAVARSIEAFGDASEADVLLAHSRAKQTKRCATQHLPAWQLWQPPGAPAPC